MATREVWRLLGLTRRERPAGALSLPAEEDEELPEPAGLTHDPLDRVLAAELQQARIERFATLKPRERRDLLLHAGGHSYQAIAELTGSTYTAVNRRITEGRAQLRPVSPPRRGRETARRA